MKFFTKVTKVSKAFNNRLSFSLTPITFASLLVMGGGLGVCQASQAATYYNCANATGCVAVRSVNPTSDFDKTKYPIVLAHGLGGWTHLFGLVDYFNGIPQDLTANGADVYATKVSAVNDTQVRGEQLLQQVKTIAAITGNPKVNLIGHSHGGIDIRYVAAVAPEYVASVTAVSSPEQGSKMADWVIKKITDGSLADGYDVHKGEFNTGSKIAMGFFNFIGKAMDFGSGIPLNQLQQEDGWAAVNALSTTYASQFNQKYAAAMPNSYCSAPTATQVNGVKYYSFSGVGTITTAIDPSDWLLALTSLPFGDDANDGLVSKCSSHLGQVIRDDYFMNHLDAVNQLLGLTSLAEANPVAIYRKHVNLLKNQGL